MRSKTREVLLIDGYNIINSWGNLKKIASYSLEEARIALITTLSEYKSFSGQEIWLVFDAHNSSSCLEKYEEIQGITVVYTKENQTADSFLEMKVKKLVEERNIEIRVATSDYAIQQSILGSGGSRISSRELLLEVNVQNEKIKKTTKELDYTKNRLSEQIDNKTKEKLENLLKTLENE